MEIGGISITVYEQSMGNTLPILEHIIFTFHSIVLLALVDSNYEFLYIDVGANGLCSDGGIFKDYNLYKALENSTLGLPYVPYYPMMINHFHTSSPEMTLLV